MKKNWNEFKKLLERLATMEIAAQRKRGEAEKRKGNELLEI